MESQVPVPTRGKGDKSKPPKKTKVNHTEIATHAEKPVLRKKRSTKSAHPPTDEPSGTTETVKKLVETPRVPVKKDKEATSQGRPRRAKEKIAALETVEREIKKVTGGEPDLLTEDESRVAVAMFLESPDLKRASAAEKKQLKDALLHPPPTSYARTKKGGTSEEEAHAAQWEMAVAMQAFHTNHMKKSGEMSHLTWATKNLATSAGLLAAAEDRLHKNFLSPLCRAILEDTASEAGLSDSSVDTLADDGILAVGDKDVPWPQNRCIFLAMQDSNCSPAYHKKLHEKAQRSSSKRARLSDFMSIVSLNPRAIHEESMALGERLHFCYDVLDVWGELLGPGRLHLGPEGLMGALKSERAVLDALPGLKSIHNPAHYRASYCGANALPTSFDASKEPQHISSFEAEVLLRGIAAFLYCNLLDGIKRHGHAHVPCETPKGEVDYRELGQTLREALASDHAHDDKTLQQSLTYLFGRAACSKLRSWDAHIEGLLSDLEIVRRKLVPWAARYHIREGVTHGFWGAAGWAKDQAERVGSLLRHRVVRKVVRHTVRSITWAVDKLQMLRWFHFIAKKALCLFYLLHTCFKGDEPRAYENLATYIFSKQVTEMFSSCVGMWNTLTSFDWKSLSSYVWTPATLLHQLGKAFWDLWSFVAASLRSVLPVSGELMAMKLNATAADSLLNLGKIIPFFSTLTRETQEKIEQAQGYLTLTIAWILPFEVLAKFAGANTYALSYVTHNPRAGFMWNLGVALMMCSFTGDKLSLGLSFLHALCLFYGYEDCEKKQQNYRTIAKLYYVMKVLGTLASGLLLAYTGGVAGGASAVFVLLFKELASDIWMLVGNPRGFLSVHCLGINDEETKDVKDKYNVEKYVEEKLKGYDEKSRETYSLYHPPKAPPLPLENPLPDVDTVLQKQATERETLDLANEQLLQKIKEKKQKKEAA